MSKDDTPMMRQYRRLRKSVPEDTVLFFRMGDFYEMFFDDATEVARLLDIALTKRNGVPMCGVPHHAVTGYLSRIIRAGKKVAMCEQMEDPATAKGLVERAITRIVTPGTVLEEPVLEAKHHNYLAGVQVSEKGRSGLAVLDLSTGDFWLEETDTAEEAFDVLVRHAPSECLVPEEMQHHPLVAQLRTAGSGTVVTFHEDWTFEFHAANDYLTRHLGVHSLQGFGCEGRQAGVGAAGAVLHYVKQELRRSVEHIRRLRVVHPGDYLLLDTATVRNLDLTGGRNEERAGGTTHLLGVLDATRTPISLAYLDHPTTARDRVRLTTPGPSIPTITIGVTMPGKASSRSIRRRNTRANGPGE